MNIFKSKGYILRKIKQGNKEHIYLVFSYDYWKISCLKKNSSKEKELDVWNLINFEIEVKQWRNIHKIRNIKVISEYNYKDISYSKIELFMNLIAYINRESRDWMLLWNLNLALEEINNNLDYLKLVLLWLKITSIFGQLELENDNETISKILKFVNFSKSKDIVKLTWIDEETKKELRGLLPF